MKNHRGVESTEKKKICTTKSTMGTKKEKSSMSLAFVCFVPFVVQLYSRPSL